MTFLDWFLLFVAALVVVGAILGSGDGLSLVFKGGVDKYKDFESPPHLRWMVVLAAGFMVVSYMGFRAAVSAAKEDYSDYRTNFDQKEQELSEAKALADRESAERARLEEREAFEARVAALEGEVTILRDEPDFRLVQAVSKIERSSLDEQIIPHTIIRHLLDDTLGEKQLAVVYHLFEDNASWEYNSPTNSDPADFFQMLYSSTTAATLGTYDYLIGIGLASNSPGQVLDMSHRRAKHLCGVLEAILPSADATPVYGLAIGDYQSESGALDIRNQPQPRQRPILFAGVERVSPSLNEQALILEMMMSFDYSGIDLRGYSLIGTKNVPIWYEMVECDRNDLDFGHR